MRRYVAWVSERALWFLLMAVPALWLPASLRALVPVSLALLIALALCRWTSRGRPIPRTPLDWPILGVLLMLPIGLWASPDFGVSWEVFCRIVLGVALFYGLVDSLEGEQGVASFSGVLVLGGVGISLLGLLAADWKADKLPFLAPVYRYLPRVTLPGFLYGRSDVQSGLFHPNMIGGTLTVLIPYGVGLMGWWVSELSQTGDDESDQFSPKVSHGPAWLQEWMPWVLRMAVVLMCGTLLLTQSRMGLLALGLVLCVWAAAHQRRLRLILFGGALCIVLLSQAWGVNGLAGFFLQMPEAGTWYARPELWRVALEAIRDYPFTGVGLGLFDPVVRANYVLRVFPEWYFGHSHNLVLQAGADLGLVGLLSFVALLVMGGYCGWRAWAGSHGRQRWLAGGAVAALLAYGVFGTLNCIPLGSKPGILFWLLLAPLVCMGRKDEQADVRCKDGRQKRRCALLVGAVVIVSVGASVALAVSPLPSYILDLNLGALWLDRVQLGVDLDDGTRQDTLGKAIDHLEGALARRDTPIVHRRLGLAYLLQGDEAKAIAHSSQDEEALLFLMLRADNELATANLESARESCGFALRLNPGLSEAWYRLGQAGELEGDANEALESYRRALEFRTFSGRERRRIATTEQATSFSRGRSGRKRPTRLLWLLTCRHPWRRTT